MHKIHSPGIDVVYQNACGNKYFVYIFQTSILYMDLKYNIGISCVRSLFEKKIQSKYYSYFYMKNLVIKHEKIGALLLIKTKFFEKENHILPFTLPLKTYPVSLCSIGV